MTRSLALATLLAWMLMTAGCQSVDPQAFERLPAVEVSGSERFRSVRIKTRPGVRQGFELNVPLQAAAVALYFRGTTGQGVGQDVRDHLFRNAIGVALVDPPSDLPRGFTAGERSGTDHVTDIDAVIRYLRSELRVPVWLIGISMGSVSVVNVGLHSRAGVDGIVFLSPITSTYLGTLSFGESRVTDFALENLRVPLLAVSHRQDGCPSTPPSGAAEIVRRATRAEPREYKLFDGGYQVSADPCVGRSYHTFTGILGEVGDTIAAFIRRRR